MAGRRRKTIKALTLDATQDIISGLCTKVHDVIVVLPDIISGDSDTEVNSQAEEEFEPAGELEIELEDLQPEPESDEKPPCKKKVNQVMPDWQSQQTLNTIFRVQINAVPYLLTQHGDIVDKTPLQHYKLFITDEMIAEITKQTILYAKEHHNTATFSISQQEMQTFIEIILLSGYLRLLHARHYWSNAMDLGHILVKQSMSLKMFKQIKKYFHLTNKLGLSKTAKVDCIYDELNKNLKQFGVFRSHLSIDEKFVKNVHFLTYNL